MNIYIPSFTSVSNISFNCFFFSTINYINKLKISVVNDKLKKLFEDTYPEKNYIENKLKMKINQEKERINKKNDNKNKSIDENIKKNIIPEWKINALTKFKGGNEFNNFKGFRDILNFITKKYYWCSNYISNIYKQSDLNLLVNDMKTSLSNISYNINLSNNPLISIPRDLIDKIESVSPITTSLELIKKYDKDINIETLENEMRVVIKQMLKLSKENDINKIKKLACDSALALIQNDLKLRKENQYEYKYKEPFFVDVPNYESCELTNPENPVMRFQVNVQECLSKIYYFHGKIIYKDNDIIQNNTYIVDAIKNPNPSLDLFGHFYMISNFQVMEKNILLI